jgi:hypothetical protein
LETILYRLPDIYQEILNARVNHFLESIKIISNEDETFVLQINCPTHLKRKEFIDCVLDIADFIHQYGETIHGEFGFIDHSYNYHRFSYESECWVEKIYVFELLETENQTISISELEGYLSDKSPLYATEPWNKKVNSVMYWEDFFIFYQQSQIIRGTYKEITITEISLNPNDRYLTNHAIDPSDQRKILLGKEYVYLHELFMKWYPKKERKVVLTPDGVHHSVCSQCIHRISKEVLERDCADCQPTKV